MEKINSFDVFDTIFGRRYFDNSPILDLIEKITKIPNFVQERKNADDGRRNLNEIYEYLNQIGSINSDQISQIKEMEIDLEMENIFPIKEMIDKIKYGDLLISDMYMSGSDILSLVRSVGMDKQVTIYQSAGDKRTGAFWNNAIQNNLQIATHYGDNAVSDVNNPKSVGINSYHSINVSESENYFITNKLNLIACLVREIRLRNDEQAHKHLFYTANQLNLPWLLFTCEMIYRKYKGTPLVFLARDCQLLYKLYNEFYERSYYLPFSRKVALNQTELAAGYLNNQIPKGATLIDISSTGRTWEKVCAVSPFNISVIIYSDIFHYSKEKPILPETFSWFSSNSVIGKTNELIELMNCGDHGYLDRIEQFGDIFLSKFGDMELDKDIVDVIHKPINDAVSLSSYYKGNLRTTLGGISDDALHQLFKMFLEQIHQQGSLMNQYPEFLKNQNTYFQGISK